MAAPRSPDEPPSQTAAPSQGSSSPDHQNGRMTVAATPVSRRSLVTETVLVLGVSLGSSGTYALLSLVNKLTRNVPLNQQP